MKGKIWDIQHAKDKLGDKLCNALLPIHVLTGCDKTPRVTQLERLQFLTNLMVI